MSTTCNSCQSTKVEIFWKNKKIKSVITSTDFMYGGRKFIYQLKKCRECGFVFQDPTIDAAEHYQESNPDNYIKMGKFRSQYFFKLKEEISKRIPLSAQTKFVDLGAGSGEWLQCFKTEEKYATEINEKLIDLLKKKNVKILSGAKEIRKITPGPELIISAFDYLEHVKNPDHFLSEISSVSNSKTYLVLGVPDMGKLAAKILGTRYYLYTPMHYSYYNAKALEELLSRHLVDIEIFRSPSMKSDLAGVFKWLRIKAPDFIRQISFPIPYRASLIAVGRIKNAKQL